MKGLLLVRQQDVDEVVIVVNVEQNYKKLLVVVDVFRVHENKSSKVVTIISVQVAFMDSDYVLINNLD